MFTQKQKAVQPASGSNLVTSTFLKAGKKKSAETMSGNDAKKYDTSGDEFVDQFSSLGKYRVLRPFNVISNDMATLWAKNPLLALCFIFYIRMITRIVSLWDGLKTTVTQRGGGLRYEGVMRMIWLSINHPNVFWSNIRVYIAIASWHDIFIMLSYDIQYNGWKNKILNWDYFGHLLLAGLENPNTNNLVKKYIPQIKANSQCKTIEAQANNEVAKWLCGLLYPALINASKDKHAVWYKKYRKLKSSGTAHEWQQLISKGLFSKINFDTIHGKALTLLVSSKFLYNHNLENVYQEWISNKPVAKFTGYVYELAVKINTVSKQYQIDTINAQYRQLVEIAGKSNSNLIVVKDTSLSMDSEACGTNVSSYLIAKSLSIFLGQMLQGYFKNHYIDFSEKAILREIRGTTFVENWNTEHRIASANTNFMGICKLFVDIFKQGVNEDQFPSGIICISDGEFDGTKMYNLTNIEAFKLVLTTAGFTKTFVKDFKFCFWDIRNSFHRYDSQPLFETFGPSDNVFYFSSFDPSVIAFLTGVQGKESAAPRNAKELFEAAMNQEVLQLLKIDNTTL